MITLAFIRATRVLRDVDYSRDEIYNEEQQGWRTDEAAITAMHR